MTAFGEYAGDNTASTVKARDYKDATDLVAYGIPGNWIGRQPENGGNSTQFTRNVSPTLTATDRHGVIHGTQDPCISDIAFSLGRNSGQENVVYNADEVEKITLTPASRSIGMSVRRLTPVECERLQGFPDNYTDIPFRGKPVTDGHRYKALGNSMAVPVMRWVGERIQTLELI